MGGLSIARMSVDIFPAIDIPVVSAIWSYGNLSPTEMQDRITTIVERALTTTVNDIEHIESQSISGTSVIKLFFQPGTDVHGAVAQVVLGILGSKLDGFRVRGQSFVESSVAAARRSS